MALAGDAADEIVSYPEWRAGLAGAALGPEVRRTHEAAILGLLRACKEARRPLSAGFIRWYLARGSLSAAQRQARRAAFAWLFKAARAQGKTRPSDRAFVPPADGAGGAGERLVGDDSPYRGIATRRGGLPPPAAGDQGGADWERDLIGAIRRKGFLWPRKGCAHAAALAFHKRDPRVHGFVNAA